MKELKICKVCGVPVRVGKDHRWGPDGTITLRGITDRRMVFFDSDGLDVLFSNIETLLNFSVQKILIESKARSTREYIKRMLRGPKGPLVRILGLNRVISRVAEQGKILGYGKATAIDFSWKERYMKTLIENPYSLPLIMGDLLGANEAATKDMNTVEYFERDPGVYEVKVLSGSYAPELTGRLLPKPRPRKPGNIEYDYCPRCGVPLEVSRFTWNLEEGTIIHAESGLRMAIFGPQGIEVFFEELEKELGEAIPATVVEAQRMYAETRMSLRSIGASTVDLRRWLAIRGMGNLVSLETSDDSVVAVIENPSLPLIVAGTALAFYEFTYNRKGRVDWSISDEGDLRINLEPA